MKVTRYPQSCLLLEKEGHKIVIDPGSFFAAQHSVNELEGIEAALYTHEHADHYDPAIATALREKGVPLYCNASTANVIHTKGACTVIENNQQFEVAGFSITAYDLPHCLLADGSDGPQNTGYLVDGVFFHPGDGKELAGLQARSMALPIAGPDISPLDAFNFAKQLGVTIAIPVHYDYFKEDAHVLKDTAMRLAMPFDLRVLAAGESTEL
ncbi:MAG TPA: MBL fold metallo-hydrolase [Candidatus Saccharimonadales bacterium]|nr:MBL fold metallo-hydrolase [Candidatus Saccharimonadales bacterium]